MSRTRMEKLRDNLGKPIKCDGCRQVKIFNEMWRETFDGEVVCPGCSKERALNGEGLISI